MPDVGDLAQDTRGRWITIPPSHCPNGHELAGGQVLVGHAACTGNHRGGHLTWTCRECQETVYGPGLGERCTVVA